MILYFENFQNIPRTYLSRIVLEVVRFPMLILHMCNFASTTQPLHTKQQCSYMGVAWASQATVPFIKYTDKYVQTSSILFKRKNKSTKAGRENPQKPAGGKNTGNVYARPKQWCNPWGFRVSKDLNYKRK